MFVKYLIRDNHLDFNNVLHFVPTVLFVQLQKDKWHPGFNGEMKRWYLNHGVGAYREKDYGEGETDTIQFGFRAGLEDRKLETGWNKDE